VSGSAFTESTVEQAALAWLEDAGWRVAHGPDISPDGDTLTPFLSQRERKSYSEVVLARRLRDALARLNPDLPADALLPRLISGELRVKDAGRFIGRAAL